MKYLIASILSIGLISLGVWSHFELFRVQDIQCTTTDQEKCPEFFMKELEPFMEHSLFLIRPLTITQSAALQSSGFQVVSYQKKLPNQLTIVVRTEKPLFALQSDSGTQTISEYGRVIETTSDQELPLIKIEKAPQPDNTEQEQAVVQNDALVEPFQTPLLEIVSQFQNHPEVTISRIIWKSPQEIEIHLGNSIRVLVDASSYNHAAEKAAAILASEKVKSDVPPIQEIDLRFDLPVLRTSQ